MIDLLGYPLLKDIARSAVSYFQKRRDTRQLRPQQALLNRFVRVFESQGIQRTQIGRVLMPTFQLKPADLLDDQRLLDMLDEPLLSHVTTMFGVERAWMDGVPGHIYPGRWTYKNLGYFIELLKELRDRHSEIELHVVKATTNNLNSQFDSGQIAVFLRGAITTLDDSNVWQDYLLDDGWVWDHPPSRIELKALCLIAWQFGLVPFCHNATQVDVDRFLDGDIFCGELLDVTHGKRWHLDDYIFTTGESAQVKDADEALAVRDYLKETGVYQLLLAATERMDLKLVSGFATS